MGDFAPESLPLIQTNLNRPPVPVDLVPAAPDRVARSKPGGLLTLVSVPAGNGKSTPLASWLDKVDCPECRQCRTAHHCLAVNS